MTRDTIIAVHDAVHHEWVTVPQIQTIPLLTSGHAA